MWIPVDGFQATRFDAAPSPDIVDKIMRLQLEFGMVIVGGIGNIASKPPIHIAGHPASLTCVGHLKFSSTVRGTAVLGAKLSPLFSPIVAMVLSPPESGVARN